MVPLRPGHWTLSGPDCTGTWDGETVTLDTGALCDDTAASALRAVLSARAATHDGPAVQSEADALARRGVDACEADDGVPHRGLAWDGVDGDEDEDEADGFDGDD